MIQPDTRILTPNERYQHRVFVRRIMANPAAATNHDLNKARESLSLLIDDADGMLELIEDLRIAAGADVPSSEILDAAPVLVVNTMYLQDM